MEIKVQISVNSEAGQPEVIQQVAHLERGALRPDTLGLSRAEARSILAGLEQALVEQQTAELLAQAQRWPRCGRARACKGDRAKPEAAQGPEACPGLLEEAFRRRLTG